MRDSDLSQSAGRCLYARLMEPNLNNILPVKEEAVLFDLGSLIFFLPSV